jgi:hypothetical protein
MERSLHEYQSLCRCQDSKSVYREVEHEYFIRNRISPCRGKGHRANFKARIQSVEKALKVRASLVGRHFREDFSAGELFFPHPIE